MTSLLRKLRHSIFPVISSDSRRPVFALASKMPGDSGRVFVSQLPHIVSSTDLDRGNAFRVDGDAEALAGVPGLLKLGTVDVCYYQQKMPFDVHIRDGFLYSVTTQAPTPLASPATELEVLDVAISSEVFALLCLRYPVG